MPSGWRAGKRVRSRHLTVSDRQSYSLTTSSGVDDGNAHDTGPLTFARHVCARYSSAAVLQRRSVDVGRTVGERHASLLLPRQFYEAGCGKRQNRISVSLGPYGKDTGQTFGCRARTASRSRVMCRVERGCNVQDTAEVEEEYRSTLVAETVIRDMIVVLYIVISMCLWLCAARP